MKFIGSLGNREALIKPFTEHVLTSAGPFFFFDPQHVLFAISFGQAETCFASIARNLG
jgi:hypothetical protein